MRSNRTRYLPALAVAGVACAIAFPLRGQGASDAPASQPTTQAATPTVGPIGYYVNNCARCHGDASAAYVGVDHPKRGKALEKVINDMANGPAQSPLDPEGLKQQTALHEAMFGRAPFVWLDPGMTGRTAGEVLPGTTLTFQPAAGPAVTPTVDDDNRFDLPKQPGTLIGRKGDAVVKIEVR